MSNILIMLLERHHEDKVAKWLQAASEEELRRLYEEFDYSTSISPTRMVWRDLLSQMLDAECKRRSDEYYSKKNGGEWL